MRQWSRAVSRPISVSNLGRTLEGVAPERIALSLDATGPTPVDRAALVIETVLTDSPQGEVLALILADAVLSLALGRDHLLPLLGPVMTARDPGLQGDDEAAIRQLALDAFRAAGCSSWGRVDVMRDRASGELLLLEVNTAPGMTSHSLVPKAARQLGVEFEELCWRILEQSMPEAATP